MKKLLIFIILAFVLSLTAAADTAYNDTYETAGGNELQQSLDRNVRDFFDSNGIDPTDYNWVNKLTEKDVLSHILSLLRAESKFPSKRALP